LVRTLPGKLYSVVGRLAQRNPPLAAMRTVSSHPPPWQGAAMRTLTEIAAAAGTLYDFDSRIA